MSEDDFDTSDDLRLSREATLWSPAEKPLTSLPPAVRIEVIEHTIADLIDLRHAALREMPYVEYLESEHWLDTRERALEHAERRCQLCNWEPSLKDTSGRTLNVHHRTYERRGHERPSDLIVLCDDCHGTFHANGTLT